MKAIRHLLLLRNFAMMRIPILVSLVLCLSSAWLGGVCWGDNWPGWRGPSGQGISRETDLPVTWSRTENVRWKVELPDEGNSSPVVWGDRVFLTQASEKTLWPPQRDPKIPTGTSGGGAAVAAKRSLMCFDRATGKLLWQRDTIYKESEPTHRTNPFCSATPVTDGERIIASHGSAGLVCYDMEGKPLWKYDVGKLDHVWGNASSPILHGDLAILWCGPGSRQFLLAVNKRTGEKVWEHVEPNSESGSDLQGTWATPTVARVGERDQLILPFPYVIKGLAPKTGRELWQKRGPGNFVYGSALFDGSLAIFGKNVYQLGAKGVIKQIRFQRGGGGRGPHSGVVAGGYLYVAGSVPSCYEIETGKEVWKSQIKNRPGTGTVWGSMVHADSKLYFTDQKGTTLVLAATPEFEVLATNALVEHTNASIAVSQGDIFIRTWKHLWCIGKEK
jgi:outer membrane protein assembly factor BamB